MKFCAFDLEIAKEIPEGTKDWHTLRPLGISCAATYDETGHSSLWYGKVNGEGMFEDQMDTDLCKQLVYFLANQQAGENRPIVTWNGLGFDFDVLLEESQCPSIIARLVPDHVDIGFAMFCDRGYMCGLEAAAIGMKVGEKLKGVKGKNAPTLWKKSPGDQLEVLKYVREDARITGLVYEAVTQTGYLAWTAQSGRPNKWKIPKSGIPTVREAMGRPIPDTSWMDNPWPREKFTKWLLALLAEEGLL
jgi:hypothetical protein